MAPGTDSNGSVVFSPPSLGQEPPSEEEASGGFMFDGIEVREPYYTTLNVAKFFFGRTSYWLRWREDSGGLVLDGKPLVPSRNEIGARSYSLADVEKVAHALAQNGAISGERLQVVLGLVRLQAKIYGYPIETEVVHPHDGALSPRVVASLVSALTHGVPFTFNGNSHTMQAYVLDDETSVEIIFSTPAEEGERHAEEVGRFVLSVSPG